MKRFTSIILGILLSFAIIISLSHTTKAATQSTISRSEAEQRALNMINLKWTYSSYNNSNINPSYAQLITQPKQLNNFSTGEMVGIPYNWGGLDGIDFRSSDTPWSNFIDAVNKGAYIGNVNTEAGYGYIPGTAGIDCSGFVQATFNIRDYKLSTSTLFNQYFIRININDLKHMDILNKPGDHVVIFDKWGTYNGIYGAYTYESTPDDVYGGIQGTKKYFISMEEINKGYIPGRYVNLVDDPVVPKPVEAGIFAKIASNTNLRSSGSMDGNIVYTTKSDIIVYLVNYSNGWYQINYNGQLLWVYGTQVSAIPSGKYVTIKNAYTLNIRTAPSITSSIIGVLSQNQYAEITDYSSDGNWFKIRVNGIEGWASSKYLSYIY